MKFNELTLKKSLELLEKKEISIDDIYRDVNEAIGKKNKELNVYLSLDKKAPAAAKTLANKSFKGVPFAVKDNFLTMELPATASAKVLDGFMPPYESTVTKRLKQNLKN